MARSGPVSGLAGRAARALELMRRMRTIVTEYAWHHERLASRASGIKGSVGAEPVMPGNGK